MNIESIFTILFFVVFALVAGSFIIKIIKHGGLKAAMFDTPIERTIGEVSAGGTKLVSIAIKVHTLSNSTPQKAIGLEFVAKSFASYQMMPVTLGTSEAQKLVTLLQSAIAGSHAT